MCVGMHILCIRVPVCVLIQFTVKRNFCNVSQILTVFYIECKTIKLCMIKVHRHIFEMQNVFRENCQLPLQQRVRSEYIIYVHLHLLQIPSKWICLK